MVGEQIRSMLADVERALAEARTRADAFERERREMEQRCAGLETRLLHAERELAQLRGALVALERERSFYRSEAETAIREVALLREIASLSERIQKRRPWASPADVAQLSALLQSLPRAA